MSRRLITTGVIIIVLSLNTFAQNISNNKFGKGIAIIAKDSSFSMKFSTRIQSLYMFETPIEADGSLGKTESTFLIRRARLKFGGFVYNPKVQYKIELGISNRDHGSPIDQTKNSARIILDAVIKWEFAKNTQLWVGQTKLPGNRERVISSQKLQFVDRSLVNSKYNLDRDMGIQLRHKWKFGEFVVKEALSLAQGEGRNITAANEGGYKYTGRLEMLPFGEFKSKGDYFGSDLKREEKPKLAIGITYDFHDGAVRQSANQKSYLDYEKDLTTIFVDMMFKYKGFSSMIEYANRQAIGSAIVTSDGDGAIQYFYTGAGLNASIGYLFKNNFEVATRYTTILPNDGNPKDDINMYTLGVSRYIVGHSLKVQSDFSYITEGDGEELLYRIQVEFSF
ncbi:MAG: FmdC precursor [Flavobacteriales bacterium]|nr:FmdC precursor [Flavobacteriales bacterium]